jgi:hypothetical protein
VRIRKEPGATVDGEVADEVWEDVGATDNEEVVEQGWEETNAELFETTESVELGEDEIEQSGELSQEVRGTHLETGQVSVEKLEATGQMSVEIAQFENGCMDGSSTSNNTGGATNGQDMGQPNSPYARVTCTTTSEFVREETTPDEWMHVLPPMPQYSRTHPIRPQWYAAAIQSGCSILVYAPCSHEEEASRHDELIGLEDTGATIVYANSLKELEAEIRQRQRDHLDPTGYQATASLRVVDRQHRSMPYKIVVVEQTVIHHGNVYSLRPAIYKSIDQLDWGLDHERDAGPRHCHYWKATLWIEFANLQTAVAYLRLHNVCPCTDSTERQEAELDENGSITCVYPYPTIVSQGVDTEGSCTVSINRPGGDIPNVTRFVRPILRSDIDWRCYGRDTVHRQIQTGVVRQHRLNSTIRKWRLRLKEYDIIAVWRDGAKAAIDEIHRLYQAGVVRQVSSPYASYPPIDRRDMWPMDVRQLSVECPISCDTTAGFRAPEPQMKLTEIVDGVEDTDQSSTREQNEDRITVTDVVSGFYQIQIDYADDTSVWWQYSQTQTSDPEDEGWILFLQQESKVYSRV